MENDKRDYSTFLKREKKIEDILFNSFERSKKLPEIEKTEKETRFIVDWQLLQ